MMKLRQKARSILLEKIPGFRDLSREEVRELVVPLLGITTFE